MQKIKYEGVDGVFIPNNEFIELQSKILAQKELINELEKEIKQ